LKTSNRQVKKSLLSSIVMTIQIT